MLIHVTSEVCGRAWFYEFRLRQGHKTLVPVYRVRVYSNNKIVFEFGVTRDTVSTVFRDRDYSPCPPTSTDRHYHGLVRTDGGRFRIQLYEESDPERCRLSGIGDKVRSHIQIHRGPGTSSGCMMVSGGQKGYRRFRQKITELLVNDSDVYIQVDPR